MLKFALLVFGLSVPAWVLGGVFRLEILPGLPASVVAVFCPFIAASILVGRERGGGGVAAFWRRCLHPGRPGAGWYVPAILLLPGLAALAYLLMRAAGVPLPPPGQEWRGASAVALGSLVAALGEEAGWTGYAVERLQERRSALGAALLVGSVWALWHVIPFVQAGRAAGWILWQSVNMLATRVVLVWLYNNAAKSVVLVAICHASSNLSWQLFPDRGSHYDPQVVGLITAGAAAVIAVVWGPRLLASTPGDGS